MSAANSAINSAEQPRAADSQQPAADRHHQAVTPLEVATTRLPKSMLWGQPGVCSSCRHLEQWKYHAVQSSVSKKTTVRNANEFRIYVHSTLCDLYVYNFV